MTYVKQFEASLLPAAPQSLLAVIEEQVDDRTMLVRFRGDPDVQYRVKVYPQDDDEPGYLLFSITRL